MKLVVEGYGLTNVQEIYATRVWPEGLDKPYLRLQFELASGDKYANWYQYWADGEKGGFTMLSSEESRNLEDAVSDAIMNYRAGVHEPSHDEGSQP